MNPPVTLPCPICLGQGFHTVYIDDCPYQEPCTQCLGTGLIETEFYACRDHTKGEAIPELPRPILLEQNSLEVQILIGKAKLFARSKGMTISTADLGAALGSYTFASNHITLRPDLPPWQTLKTLLHEIAHALMHRNSKEERRHVLELEAESCAFLVCDALGLDTSQYSFPNIANWTEDPNEILPAAEKACKVADEILLVLDVAQHNLKLAA
jgi:hypothetical protein